VSEFLLETYVSDRSAEVSPPGAKELSLAADELTSEGTPVRLVRSIFVPEEETAFYLFRATSAEAVREAATRAGLRAERVSEARSAG
jgi:Nickel responsive protein SCO4226-like